MQVDRAGVDDAVGARHVDRAEHPTARALDDRDDRAGPAQRHEIAGPLLPGPVPAVAAASQQVLGDELVGALRHRRAEDRDVRGGERHLGGGRGEVRAQHVGVGRVEGARLDRGVEHRLGMAHEVVVEGVVAGEEHREALATGAPRPSRALPQRGPRARPAGHDDGVEPADVDPQLQGARRREPAQPPAAQLLLQLAALLGQVAAAISGDEVRQAALLQAGEGPVGDDLDPEPRAREDHGLHPLLDEIGEQVSGAAQCAHRLALSLRRLGRLGRLRRLGRLSRISRLGRISRLSRISRISRISRLIGRRRLEWLETPRRPVGFGVGDGVDRRPGHRLDEGDGHPRPRRPVMRHGLDVETAQIPGVPRGVGDGRGGEGEGRVGPVAGRDPPQAPQHLRDVRPEDPAIGVALVDDDEFQAPPEGRPRLMAGQHAVVQHVRIRQHEPGVPADAPPLVAGGVAVVGRRDDARQGHPADPLGLVGGERLRRAQVERGAAADRAVGLVVCEAGQDRQEVALALARGGARRDDRVPALVQRLRRRGLVLPQLLHALAAQRLAQRGRHPVRHRGQRRVAGRDPADVAHPAVLGPAQQFGPRNAGIVGGHRGLG